MARYKHKAKKKRLDRKRRQTKWAPFWVITRTFRTMGKIHPSRKTVVKRHWSKTKLKA